VIKPEHHTLLLAYGSVAKGGWLLEREEHRTFDQHPAEGGARHALLLNVAMRPRHFLDLTNGRTLLANDPTHL
jgi:hypothetical protein